MDLKILKNISIQNKATKIDLCTKYILKRVKPQSSCAVRKQQQINPQCRL